MGYDGEYVVRGISEFSTGLYTCRANVPGFLPETRSATVFMKGPPLINRRASRKIQFGRIGDIVEIKCDISSIPRPNLVQWTQFESNHPIPTQSGHYRVTTLIYFEYIARKKLVTAYTNKFIQLF